MRLYRGLREPYDPEIEVEVVDEPGNLPLSLGLNRQVPLDGCRRVMEHSGRSW